MVATVQGNENEASNYVLEKKVERVEFPIPFMVDI